MGLPRFNVIEAGHVTVSYRAAAHPQTVRFTVARNVGASPVNLWADRFAGMINAGIAGGSEFSPLDGRAVLEPVPPPEGGVWKVEMEMASVSPFFIFEIVKTLAPASSSMSVVGDLPADTSSASLTEGRIRELWDDPDGRLGAWAPVPFPVEESRIARGAALRVRFKSELPKGYVDAPYSFGVRLMQISSMLQYAHAACSSALGAIDTMPKDKQTKREISVRWDTFDVRPERFRALLMNMLIWVHEKEHPIESVKLHWT